LIGHCGAASTKPPPRSAIGEDTDAKQKWKLNCSTNQKTEAKIACNTLNRVTSLGMPISIRIK
jgi:invasion protein IalB